MDNSSKINFDIVIIERIFVLLRGQPKPLTPHIMNYSIKSINQDIRHAKEHIDTLISMLAQKPQPDGKRFYLGTEITNVDLKEAQDELDRLERMKEYLSK